MADQPRMGRTEGDRWTDTINLGRRGVVAGGGVLLTAATLRTTPGGREILEALLDPAATTKLGKVRVERVRRQHDLLAVNLIIGGMKIISRAGVDQLTPTGATGFIGVVLPGQSFGEEIRVDTPLDRLAKAELAAPSVLAFTVKKGRRIGYDLASLLTWTGLTPSWKDATERPSSRIEAPYRLLLQPYGGHVWQHATVPVRLKQADNRTTAELWHTRLTKLDGEKRPDQRRASVVEVVGALPTKLTTSLTPQDREDIAFQAQVPPISGATPQVPAQADRLILTSLGATLELHGSWPRATNLVAWDHRSALGRDSYVKVVTKGYLAPWGTPTVVVVETFRRMTQVNGHAVAQLVQESTLVVNQAEVDTSAAFDRVKPGGKTGGPQIPFVSVRSSVSQTPRIKGGSALRTAGGPVLLLSGERLVLPFVGTDWTGRRVPFESAVRFVPNKVVESGWTTEPEEVRRVGTGGQQIAVSPEPGDPGVMTLPVASLLIDVVPIQAALPSGPTSRAPFRPVVRHFAAEVPAMSALTGGTTIKHEYHPSWLADQANKGGVVVGRVAESGNGGGTLSGETTGGFLETPAYQGLSHVGGAILAADPAALVDIAAGYPGDTAQSVETISDLFGGITLLGAIPLSSIVSIVPGADTKIPSSVPTVRSVSEDGAQVVTMTITPALKRFVAGGVFQFDPVLKGKAGKLSIVAVTAAGGDGPAAASLDARLTNVTLQLADLVVLPIEEFRVTTSTAAPFDAVFKTGDLEFLGPLSFVNTLSDIAQFLGLARAPLARGAAQRGVQPPSVDVTSDGIEIRQSLTIDDTAVGPLTLSGLSFSLGVRLPFAGDFVVLFGFASHEDPFTVTYGPFGGSGYVALELTGGDVSYLELSLAASGRLGLDLGVASGAVAIDIGFVLALPSSGSLSFTAFLRASGSLSVLGLITVSTVFEIAFEFVNSNPTKLTGYATLEFKVEVLFVSKTVRAKASRTIKGSAPGQGLARGASRASAPPPLGDATRPSFETTYDVADLWADYCDSFAPKEAL